MVFVTCCFHSAQTMIAVAALHDIYMLLIQVTTVYLLFHLGICVSLCF